MTGDGWDLDEPVATPSPVVDVAEVLSGAATSGPTTAAPSNGKNGHRGRGVGALIDGAERRTTGEMLVEYLRDPKANGRHRAAIVADLTKQDEKRTAAREVIAEADRAARTGPEKKAPGVALSSLAAEILAFSRAPRVSWGLAELDRVAPWPAGSVVVLVGGPGSGKTSLALQVAQHHACRPSGGGPVLFLSLELARVVLAARAAAQSSTSSWLAVLEGGLDKAQLDAALGHATGVTVVDAEMLAERQMTWRQAADAHLAHWRKIRPAEVPMLVVDYAQLLAAHADASEIRVAVSRSMQELAEVAKAYRAAVLAVVQPSRSGAKALRSGEAVGMETAEMGAESAGIERWTVAQVALGERGEELPSGWRSVATSVSKVRFGAGDHVVPLEYHGASGTWRDAGRADTAENARAKAGAERNERRQRLWLERAHEYLVKLPVGDGEWVSGNGIFEEIGGGKDDKGPALRMGVREGRLEQRGAGRSSQYRAVRAVDKFSVRTARIGPPDWTGPESDP